MTTTDTHYYAPLDTDSAIHRIAARVQARRDSSPTVHHQAVTPAVHPNTGVVTDPYDEAAQLYDLIVNPEPQRYFPQHAVDMVRLNRAFMTSLTPAYIDRQLSRVWHAGGRPWFIPHS